MAVNNQIYVTVCLSTFTAASVVHAMETVMIFYRLLLIMIVMMIILIDFAVAICNELYDDVAGECVYFSIHFILSVYNLSYSVA
jgi:hypothetical protein